MTNSRANGSGVRAVGRGRSRRIAAIAAAVVAAAASLVVAAAPASAAPIGTVVSYGNGAADRVLTNLVPGPGGTLWYLVVGGPPGTNAIGSITVDGTVTEFTGPDIVRPSGLVAGPDGNVWFADRGATSGGWIGRITPAGVVTAFRGAWVTDPSSITAGPDGNLWFTDHATVAVDDGHIGTVTPAGVGSIVTEADRPAGIMVGAGDDLWWANRSGVGAVGADGSDARTYGALEDLRASELLVGPDGAMWFLAPSDDAIVRVDADGPGELVRYATPGGRSPLSMTVGPDQKLWFTMQGGEIATLTTGGVLTPIPQAIGGPQETIDLGPDGNLWTADADGPGYGIRRITPAGVDTDFDSPTDGGLQVGPDGRLWYLGGTNFGYTEVYAITVTEDGVPMFPTAVAGKGSATVSWVPPAVPVDGPVTGYEVTASPGGATCATTTATSCVVPGLTAGVPHTFSIAPIGSGGPGPEAVTTVPVVPWSGSRFHPVVPHRILDSRSVGSGFSGPVTSAAPRALQVTGLGGPSDVPASASSVVLNVTVTDSSEPSFVTVFPWGSDKPNASNVNVPSGNPVANLVTVAVGDAGRVAFATSNGSTNVIADVVGYYDDGVGSDGGLYNPTTPVRLLDTRTGGDPVEEGAPVDLVVRDDGGATTAVPASATAVVVNLTVTSASDQTFVAVWPTGEPKPNVSNLNSLPGQTLANLVTVKIGDGGQIRIANTVGDVDVIVDLVGWFEPGTGSRFHAIEPNRILDTRVGTGLVGAQGPGQTRALAVAGAAGSGVPAGATGLVANVTGVDATAETFVAVFPGQTARPNPYSTLNLAPGGIVPNLVAVGIAPDGTIDLYNHLGTTALVADAAGWYGTY